MSIDLPESELDQSDSSWQQIERLIDEIADLASSEVAPPSFHSELLERAVTALAAVGGAIWIRQSDRALKLQCGIRVPDGIEGDVAHSKLLAEVLSASQSRIVAPRSGASSHELPSNPTDYLLVVSALKSGDELVGVIEIFQRAGASPAAQQGYLELVGSMCELAGEYYRNCELRELQQQRSESGRLAEFTKRIHASLGLTPTAFAIANEGRSFVGCNRLSVLTSRRTHCRVVAVSGVFRIDRRSNSVRMLERLVRAVLKAGMTLHFSGSGGSLPADELPPEIERPLHAYLDESHTRVIEIVPLKGRDSKNSTTPNPTIGALVVEHFDAEYEQLMRQRVETTREHSEIALRNALEFQSLPLSRLLQRATWLVRLQQLPKTLVAAGLLAAIVLALVFVPADFEVEARGQLRPQNQRDIFAPRDGTVSELLVRDEKRVAKDARLVVLRNSQLELDFKRVWGEIQTATKRLSAVQAARVENEIIDSNRDRPDRNRQLSADEAELKALLASLNEQHEALKKQQDELTICSPIDGVISAWDVTELLESRPVKLGQVMMSVIDTDGPWKLELLVPDDQAGHVLRARKELGEDLKVSFKLATNASTTYDVTIDRIAMSTEMDESQQPTVKVTAIIDNSRFPQLRPGASVTARIYCGRRSVGYVWLHELFEAIQTRILF